MKCKVEVRIKLPDSDYPLRMSADIPEGGEAEMLKQLYTAIDLGVVHGVYQDMDGNVIGSTPATELRPVDEKLFESRGGV